MRPFHTTAAATKGPFVAEDCSQQVVPAYFATTHLKFSLKMPGVLRAPLYFNINLKPSSQPADQAVRCTVKKEQSTQI